MVEKTRSLNRAMRQRVNAAITPHHDRAPCVRHVQLSFGANLDTRWPLQRLRFRGVPPVTRLRELHAAACIRVALNVDVKDDGRRRHST